MKQLQLALIGAGERGAECYAPYALKYPQEVCFVAVAEPDESRRKHFAERHGIPQARQFTNWDELLSAGLPLDGVIVANQDQQHYEPVMMAFEKGYHVLCEKPMAETYEKSRRMVEASEAANRLLMVCHVLRYTPFFAAMQAEIAAGNIGDVRAVHHIENIGIWHFAHSFVRGNWRNTKESTPMIVAKCSHDMDIINFLVGKTCQRLSSFGQLSFFTSKNAPAGAAQKCTECPLNKKCAFSSYHYFEDRPTYKPFRDILENSSGKPLSQMLQDSQYNRCVFYCDNDAVDSQTVQMEYEGGLTVSFTASAFTNDISRQIKIMGTTGELEGCVEDNAFYRREFASGNSERISVYAPKTNHAGGDERIMAHFCDAIKSPSEHPEVSGRFSLGGHKMAFAAEYSRLNGGKVIELEDF